MKATINVAIAVAALLVGPNSVLAAPADENPAQTTIPARWVPRELHFVYQGFTSLYSCDGLIGEMKQILQQLGAGSDLVLKPSGCTQLSGPELMPGLYAKFSVLEPAGADDHGAAGSAGVIARWDTVELDADTPRQRNSGGCEFIEQINKQVVPLFTTRNVTFTSNCFPHNVSLAGAHLSVEVLRPDKPAIAAPQ